MTQLENRRLEFDNARRLSGRAELVSFFSCCQHQSAMILKVKIEDSWLSQWRAQGKSPQHIPRYNEVIKWDTIQQRAVDMVMILVSPGCYMYNQAVHSFSWVCIATRWPELV